MCPSGTVSCQQRLSAVRVTGVEISSELPDKECCHGPPGWGLGRDLTAPSRKKRSLVEPLDSKERRNKPEVVGASIGPSWKRRIRRSPLLLYCEVPHYYCIAKCPISYLSSVYEYWFYTGKYKAQISLHNVTCYIMLHVT